MAKGKEKDQKTTATEVNVDNVMDQVRSKNLQNEASVKAALEEIEKETDEKKKMDAMRAIKKFQYKNIRALIELRKRRAEDKITKEYLTATKETLDKYLAGELTILQAEEKDKKDAKTKADGFNKIDEDFSKEIRELQDAYPGYWSYEWDRTWF